MTTVTGRWTFPYYGVTHLSTKTYTATVCQRERFTDAYYYRRGEGITIEKACFFAREFCDDCLGSTEEEYREWGLGQQHTERAKEWAEERLRLTRSMDA